MAFLSPLRNGISEAIQLLRDAGYVVFPKVAEVRLNTQSLNFEPYWRTEEKLRDYTRRHHVRKMMDHIGDKHPDLIFHETVEPRTKRNPHPDHIMLHSEFRFFPRARAED